MVSALELMCGSFVFIGLIVLVTLIWSNNRMDKMRQQAREIAANFEATCPICEHDQVTWGLVQSSFYPGGQNMMWAWGAKPIMAFRCDNCGHLMFFTEPPAQIKRKRQPVE